jgi:hypothetical protein
MSLRSNPLTIFLIMKFLLLLLYAARRHSGLAAFGSFSWQYEMSGAYPITLLDWLHRHCHRR